MLKNLKLIVIIATLVVAGANATPITDTTDVIVYSINDSVPETANFIDDFKFGDGGFKIDCQYQTIIEKAKQKALKAGGNAIKLTEVKAPDMWSSCYRVKGKILKVSTEAFEEQAAKQNSAFDEDEGDATIDPTRAYATLYLYRPKSFAGSAIGYNVYLDDSIICRITNNSKYEIKVRVSGNHKVWAKTEAKALVTVNVKAGKSYYIKCGIQTGFWVGQPQMILMYPTQGKEEYELVKGRVNKNKEKETE